MAKATEVQPKTIEEVGDTPAKNFVSDEMKAAAKASAEARNVKAEEKREGVGQLRRQGRGDNSLALTVSDIPYPAEVHGKDFEHYGPMGQAAVIPEGTAIAETASEQEFVIDEDRVTMLSFARPGRNLPKKTLYNIKGIHKDGTFVQLGFEPQIQNNAGGDPEDAIGLRRYQRKGIHMLIDWDTLIPVYCAAWGCWARAEQSGNWVGFCALRHAQHTLPNQYKGSSEISKGLMETGVTTSSIWGS